MTNWPSQDVWSIHGTVYSLSLWFIWFLGVCPETLSFLLSEPSRSAALTSLRVRGCGASQREQSLRVLDLLPGPLFQASFHNNLECFTQETSEIMIVAAGFKIGNPGKHLTPAF